MPIFSFAGELIQRIQYETGEERKPEITEGTVGGISVFRVVCPAYAVAGQVSFQFKSGIYL